MHFCRDASKVIKVRDDFFQYKEILRRISFNVRKYFLIKDAQSETLRNLWDRELDRILKVLKPMKKGSPFGPGFCAMLSRIPD